MFSFGSTSRLNIQSKLGEVKGLDRDNKDKRSTKRYKGRVKANKEINSGLGYYQYSIQAQSQENQAD